MSTRLRQIPIQISVQACAQSITLDRYLQWHPGTILTFDQLAETPLQLMIGQREIGDCHAVKAGEQLAVQIRSIAGNRS